MPTARAPLIRAICPTTEPTAPLAAPGLLQRALFTFFWHPGERTEPVAIDRHLVPGETLPVAGDIEVVPAPGHCASQVALLWRRGRMLFAGDACTNLLGLGDPVGFEDTGQGRDSQRRLAGLSFGAAGLGRGKPIDEGASARFRAKWPGG